MRKGVLLGILGCFVVFGADKNARESTSGAENDKIEIQARLILDKEDITKALGAELPPGIVVVEITATPHGDEPVSIGRDDFTLVSHNDGQRSGPYGPSQIAGNDVLIVRQTAEQGGAYGQNNGPIWGGIPGTMGRPRQGPGSGGGVGMGPGQTSAEAEVKTGEKGKENPLLKTLQAKTLPDSADTKDPVKGFLYFPLEGKKHKTKDMELLYRGPGGHLDIPFK